MRRVKNVLAVLVIGGSLLIGAAAPASAFDDWNGRCESTEVCLYYYPDYRGYIYDTPYDDVNYSIRHFIGTSVRLNDNTMSLKNAAWYQAVSICKDSWFGGPCLKTGPGYNRANLGDLNNQGSSHFFHYL